MPAEAERRHQRHEREQPVHRRDTDEALDPEIAGAAKRPEISPGSVIHDEAGYNEEGVDAEVAEDQRRTVNLGLERPLFVHDAQHVGHDNQSGRDASKNLYGPKLIRPRLVELKTNHLRLWLPAGLGRRSSMWASIYQPAVDGSLRGGGRTAAGDKAWQWRRSHDQSRRRSLATPVFRRGGGNSSGKRRAC